MTIIIPPIVLWVIAVMVIISLTLNLALIYYRRKLDRARHAALGWLPANTIRGRSHFTTNGKQVLMDGRHWADAHNELIAEMIRNALNHMGRCALENKS